MTPLDSLSPISRASVRPVLVELFVREARASSPDYWECGARSAAIFAAASAIAAGCILHDLGGLAGEW